MSVAETPHHNSVHKSENRRLSNNYYDVKSFPFFLKVEEKQNTMS